jgi:Leucine-rich repeat (LRR) protein
MSTRMLLHYFLGTAVKMDRISRTSFGSDMLRLLFKSNLPSLVYLDISNMQTSLDGIDLSGFSGASSLKTLIMRNCDVRDLSGIPRLPALTSLDLSYNKVKNDQVIHLVNMTGLTSLNLCSNYITPACFEYLPGTLTYLNISGCKSAGDDESEFKKLPTTITRLVANYCNDMYFGDLSHMTSLASLSLIENECDTSELLANLPPTLERKSIKM